MNMINVRQITALTAGQFRELCDLLVDSVEGGASVGFLSPLSMEKAGEYWRTVADALPSGLALFIAEDESSIVGSVQLAPCARENGLHRAEIQKLFVLRSHRGQGIATELMHAAQTHALSLGRTLLVLDTHAGSKAEALYEHLGWKRAGSIPDYAASPDGTLHGTVFLYKRISPNRDTEARKRP
ncbi:MAG: GNAT family N-acetyltransferase [Pseudodesulfovibrio sp.]|uniref:GCN5-related N-acetyltransferase n=1 Tax=Pseudodesulfovibrio aespoeensis (strain ATCC 700646 / DSM 10631 / Aspo-2) TaxID=643562 RepID=E6VVZ3_PSEA9|nr:MULTISPECIES: GNAT family N-acetyltransferase [Pseudodesulfovibrio]ADU62438.1 GCN5-related N-acetyltransferase [Pseudodesulfovibrio aespoeensis Aspo-2]MBV1764378.1 GNAT family N-acetyltransferase [Pseudodesulfovibrio sp.]MBV1771114.1 GNAT family N-acetyltransferase [Pseudodesulfovibrio sp.]MCG2732365.1 GNAT family N-acetyltransferase [Pseudodesulfovibrio aespoeensis]